VVNLASNEISGFEALLRWRHPERGMVPPSEFIPLAEEIGMINAIGAWVLKQACTEAARWPDPIKVAVNLSAIQFKGGTVILDVVSALSQSGLGARRLELEITETALLQDSEATLAMLYQLRELGVCIVMDDFHRHLAYCIRGVDPQPSATYTMDLPFSGFPVPQTQIGV
jgi:EAL domain-containing protein (putative c-di-GMP-specific phosphodiesterase class I)